LTALADLLRPADRVRLLEHLAEADDLDRLMRERGTPASPGEPVPLHRAGRIAITDVVTESTTNSSTGRTTS
jgi:hypothetical protein